MLLLAITQAELMSSQVGLCLGDQRLSGYSFSRLSIHGIQLHRGTVLQRLVNFRSTVQGGPIRRVRESYSNPIYSHPYVAGTEQTRVGSLRQPMVCVMARISDGFNRA